MTLPPPKKTETHEPCAHGGKQHANPAFNKGQEETCCLTQRNVTLIRSCSRPGSVRCKNSSWHWPSMTRMSPWPRQHKCPSLSEQDLPFHLKGAEVPKQPAAHRRSANPHTCSIIGKGSGSRQLAPLPQHTMAPSGVR